jgi:hypothetical protein
MFPRLNKSISQIKKKKNQEGWTGAYLIFLVTTAMTSSWAAAERRKVASVARERENWYEPIVDAVVHVLVPLSRELTPRS